MAPLRELRSTSPPLTSWGAFDGLRAGAGAGPTTPPVSPPHGMVPVLPSGPPPRLREDGLETPKETVTAPASPDSPGWAFYPPGRRIYVRQSNPTGDADTLLANRLGDALPAAVWSSATVVEDCGSGGSILVRYANGTSASVPNRDDVRPWLSNPNPGRVFRREAARSAPPPTPAETVAATLAIRERPQAMPDRTRSLATAAAAAASPQSPKRTRTHPTPVISVDAQPPEHPSPKRKGLYEAVDAALTTCTYTFASAYMADFLNIVLINVTR